MSPNLENQMPDLVEIEPNQNQINLTLTPISDLSASTSLSDGIQSSGSESHEEVLVDELADLVVGSVFANLVSLEHNIRELLVRVSGTERLETVTQINLRVIAREVALQQLGTYLPALRELTLDGSIISSFRDLGYGLRHLKILKVNRCQLTCIDGVFGFENLEELYAADNSIKDLSPCAFFSNLRIIDVRRYGLTITTST
ncbi:hypothetical protein HUJ04_001759 [Dendroctonus ponderosae]|nr:hypothetical protein HUJ04_001759 [Dendroctonus ponderosae]